MAKNEDHVRDSEVGPDPLGDPAAGGGAHAKRLPERLPADSAAAQETERGRDAYDEVRHTRSASLWSGLVAGAVVLLVLLAFIVQNQENTQITLLFWEAHLPLGVSLLIAAILGALTVGLAGGLRIFQLRRAAKKLRH